MIATLDCIKAKFVTFYSYISRTSQAMLLLGTAVLNIVLRKDKRGTAQV